MSGTSDNKPCPVCERDMEVYTDWKPFDTVNMRCVHCGFYGYVKIGMECEEDRRASWEASGLDMADFEPLSDADREEYLEGFRTLCGPGELSTREEAEYLNRPIPAGNSEQDQPLNTRGKVVVTVRGGVAYVEQSPSGIEVEIVDYDNRDETDERKVS